MRFSTMPRASKQPSPPNGLYVGSVDGVNGAAFTIGGVRDILTRRGFESGIGVAVTLHAMPALLDPFYGAHPVGFQVFFRLRRAEHVVNMQ